MSHSVISIHAPTRGATIDVLLNSASAQFQSTLPRGERHITGATTCSRLNFNPRSHEGSDRLTNLPHTVTWISIHAPTRGATFVLLITHTFIYISIHAPTRGATVHIMPPSADFIISIHAPTRGATQAVLSLIDSLIISIHAPTRGATILL